MTAWATRDEAIEHWREAADMPPGELDRLLAAATEALEPFAPALQVDVATGNPVIPERFKIACALQAREFRKASKRDGDLISSDSYPIRARDLTATVRQLLRPRRGRPGIG